MQPVVITYGPRSRRRVALTFDACTNRSPNCCDEGIARVLVESATPATLFLGGRWMRELPSWVSYLASIPHFELGSHGYEHLRLTELSDEAVKSDLELSQQTFQTLTGRKAALFRPPFGDYDERVVRLAAGAGLRTVLWDLPSGDPDPNFTADVLTEHVVRHVRNGSIVVMHLNCRGWHTAEALPRILCRLQTRRLGFTTVGEMITAFGSRGPR